MTTTAGCWWASYSLAGNATMLVDCPTARAPMLKNALPAIRASSRCSVVQPADPFFSFFWGGRGTPFSPSWSGGCFPFPFETGETASSETSKGSFGRCWLGRHAMYCHGSPHVHALSAEAAISILNWMSYSSHARRWDDRC